MSVVDGVGRDLALIPPSRVEPTSGFLGVGVVEVTGREGQDLVTVFVKRLQLGSEIDGFGHLGVPTVVESRDTDGITGSNKSVSLLVQKNKGEETVQMVDEISTMFLVLEACVSLT